MERVLPWLDEPSFNAVFDVGELDPAVADRAAAECVQPSGDRPHFVGHLHGFAGEQTGVAVAIGDDPGAGRDLAVPFDQAADGGGETGREAARSEHGNGDGHQPPIIGLIGLVHRVLEKLGADADSAAGDRGFDQKHRKSCANAQH